MEGATEPVEVVGLTDVLLDPTSASAATQALKSLNKAVWPQTVFAVAHSLRSRWPSVRAAAIRFLRDHSVLLGDEFEAWKPNINRLLAERLRTDNSWAVRRDAFSLLAENGCSLEKLVFATHDPHWRVRHAFLEHAKQSGISPAQVNEETEANPRTAGVLAYLRYLRDGSFEFDVAANPQGDFYDPDPAVMADDLRKVDRERIPMLQSELPQLLRHTDQRIRKSASKYLLEFADARTLAEAGDLLNDPREFGWPDANELFRSLSPSRAEEVATEVLAGTEPGLTPLVRWAQMAAGQSDEETHKDDPLKLLSDRLTPEQSTIQRRSSLSKERAEELVASPTLESSWLVLREACRMLKQPLTVIAPLRRPLPRKNEASSANAPCSMAVHEQDVPQETLSCPQVPFGDLKIPVSRMGLSGHYRLPEQGFALALDCGINLTFWEPNYDTMTRFFRSLSAEKRSRVHVIAGSFAADAKSIRADVERTLRSLRVDCLTLFMLFWVRSWQRLTDEVRDVLAAMREEGKIRMHGLSTHNRQLAVKAIEEHWNPVMVRHSIAHRGAEKTVFPVAIEHGTSIITFNNTCYGRLLEPVSRSTAPTAAECYRYTLNHPAVSCCLTAPSNVEQLQHNLSAFESAWNPQRKDLLEHGDLVYEQDRYFRISVRSVP